MKKNGTATGPEHGQFLQAGGPAIHHKKVLGKQTEITVLLQGLCLPGIRDLRIGKQQGRPVYFNALIGVIQGAGTDDQRYLVKIAAVIRQYPAAIITS